LYISEIAVVLVVGKEHILHLLQMNVRTYVCERGRGIWVRRVFAGKKWDCTIGSVDILLCYRSPQEWEALVQL
jgi:hypothetical protein